MFLTRHAHARTHKHTKMHRCNHAARIPSCADPHRRTRRTLSLLVVVVLDILSISLCPKSRVRLMPLSTGAGRRSLSHTQTLCSKTYVTVFLSLSLSLSFSLCFRPSCSSSSLRLHHCPSAITEQPSHKDRSVSYAVREACQQGTVGLKRKHVTIYLSQGGGH